MKTKIDYLKLFRYVFLVAFIISFGIFIFYITTFFNCKIEYTFHYFKWSCIWFLITFFSIIIHLVFRQLKEIEDLGEF